MFPATASFGVPNSHRLASVKVEYLFPPLQAQTIGQFQRVFVWDPVVETFIKIAFAT